MSYTGGTEQGALGAEAQLSSLARAAGICFRFDQRTDWQPIESQRALLWAGRQGKAEQFMDRLNYRHFEKGESASDRKTVLAAMSDAGMDAEEATKFLDTKEMEDTVWKSYGSTIHEAGIHAIPFFVFSAPELGVSGGPLRGGPPETRERWERANRKTNEPWMVNGSMDPESFLDIFHQILAHWRKVVPQSA
mmetsp:Transcript_46453/g.110687  ORF Transcript_46453/g.110687 Transcript_46453/m.110687 type:complete len:192 (+) Transcript_46453:419-994(+)